LNGRRLDLYADCNSANAGFDIFDEQDYDRRQDGYVDASDFIVDIREYDVPYHVRVAIDKGNISSLYH
jgi:DNA polymerase epsilon subunit 1